MNRVFITVLSSPIRKVFGEIIADQIAGLRKSKSVNLSLNTTETENDSPLVTQIKKQLKDSQARTVERLGSIGADLIQSSSETNERLVNEARALRKRADDLLSQARKIHNAQQFMLDKGDALPLALALDLVDGSDKSLVEKHVESVKVPDYFGKQNPKKAK